MIKNALTTIPPLLAAWQETLVSWVRSSYPDLTNRQMAILMVVSLDEKPHTVRGLAGYLEVAKPVISRALDTLSEFNYIERVQDLVDRRNLFVMPTEAGLEFLKSFTSPAEVAKAPARAASVSTDKGAGRSFQMKLNRLGIEPREHA